MLSDFIVCVHFEKLKRKVLYNVRNYKEIFWKHPIHWKSMEPSQLLIANHNQVFNKRIEEQDIYHENRFP
jgi:hypothetical protein